VGPRTGLDDVERRLMKTVVIKDKYLFTPSTANSCFLQKGYFCNHISDPAFVETPSNGSSPLPKHFRLHVYIFSLFRALVLTLTFSLHISATFFIHKPFCKRKI
jgi:hypothetical protein